MCVDSARLASVHGGRRVRARVVRLDSAPRTATRGAARAREGKGSPVVARTTPGELPTPSQMVAHLDRYVHAQARAKRDLAVAVYTHYLGHAAREQGVLADLDDLGRQHVLLIGPPGVGKTLLVRTLAELLDVPVVHASATSLVETGYVGEPVEGLVRALWGQARGDRARAERGLVFLDELDKIRRAADVSRDVSGEGVQNGLLTLLEGRPVPGRRDDPSSHLDSGRLLFVCAGAFVGLDAIVARRAGRGERLGFGGPREAAPAPALAEALRAEDLVRFGLIPELVGRFATVSALDPLSREDLVRILDATERSVLARQRAFFHLHGVELDFEPEALHAIAAEAQAAGLGARGLARVVLRVLRGTTARLPELSTDGVARIRVHADCIRAARAPELVRGTREHEPLAERLRRPVAPRSTSPSGSSSTSRPPGPRPPPLEPPRDVIGWERASEAARRWWLEFEQRNQKRSHVVWDVARALVRAGGDLAQLFRLHEQSGCAGVRETLALFDAGARIAGTERHPPAGVDDEEGPASGLPF